MASLVLGVAGAAIGSPFGFASLGFSIGSALGSALFPTNTTVKGPRLLDLKVQSSTYGKMLPIHFGVNRLAGNMIWSTPKVEHRKKKKQGGKGGPTQTTVSYTYSSSFAIAICEGPITGIRRIWANNKLIYDFSETASISNLLASVQSANGITVYPGTETQLPNSLIQANAGVANTSAYRGVAYAVFNNFYLTDYGNQIPNFEFEVIVDGDYTYTTQNVSLTPLGNTVNFNKCCTQITSPSKIRVINGGWNTSYTGPFTVYAYDLYSNGTVVLASAINGYSIPWDTFNGPTLGHGNCDVDGFITNITSGTTKVYFGYYAGIDPLSGLDLWITYTLTGFSSSDGSNVCCYKSGDNLFVGINGTNNVYLYKLINVNTFRTLAFTGTGNIVDLDGTDSYLYALEFDGGSTYSVRKYNKSDYALISTIISVSGTTSNIRMKVVSDSEIYLWYSSSIYEISSGNAVEYFSNITTIREITSSFNIFENISLTVGDLGISGTSGAYLTNKSLDRNSISLSTVISALCLRSGLTADKIDVSAISQILYGYTISNVAPIRSALEPLLTYGYIDAIEVDGKIKFVNRGGSSLVTIPEDDLAAHEYGSDMPDQLQITRKQEVELPLETVVSYIDFDNNYQTGTQYSRRLITSSKQVNDIQLAIVMTATKGKEIADVLEYVGWQERNTLKAQVGNKYSQYVPTDIITVPKGNISFVARITNRSEANDIISFDLVSEDSSAVYTQAQTAIASETPVQTINFAGDTKCYLLDIPILRDQDDGVGIYAAANGYFSGWSGAQLYKSTDASSYVTYGDGFLNGATIGTTNGILGDWLGGNIFDEANTVSITLLEGLLSSTTELAVLNGANLCLIGSEILQFKNATLTGTLTYTLSGLLRARKGTSRATGSHLSGEKFILLDESSIYLLSASSSEYNLARNYKAVTFGQDINDALNFQFTNTVSAQKPYAPVQLAAGVNDVNDVIFTWIRQSRIGQSWLDNTDVPLDELSENYSLDIYNAGGTSILRTLTSTTNTVTYTRAQQSTDFGLVDQSSYIVSLYQVGAIGRGFPNSATLTIPFLPTTVALLHFNGTNGSTAITDETGAVWSVNGNAQISTAQSVFGGAAMLLDGTGDYLSIAHNIQYAANIDFTLECRIRPATISSIRTIVSKRTPTTASDYELTSDASGHVGLTVFNSSGSSILSISTTTAMVINTWYSVAFTRSGNVWYLFLNGNLEASGTQSGTYGAGTGAMFIGRENNTITTRDFNGYIDELKITRRLGLYTATYTPAAAEFTYT